MTEDDALQKRLLDMLGPEAFMKLLDLYAGVRLFVPEASGDRTKLTDELGAEAVDRLVSRWARTYIRVPLARDWRARQYRAAGWSNAQIARKLGMAETSVDKLFHRMPAKPAKGSGDPRQLKLFG